MTAAGQCVDTDGGTEHDSAQREPATPNRLFGGATGEALPSNGPLRGQAPLAQSAERFHGKEKVNGSIPLGGSVNAGRLVRHTRRCSSVG